MTPTTLAEVVLRVPGLDCPDELALIRRALAGVPGCGTCEPNYLVQTLRIAYDPSQASVAVLAAAVGRAGFAAVPANAVGAPETPVPPAGSWKLVTTVIGGGLLALAGVLAFGSDNPALARAVAVAATMVSGIPVVVAAVRALRLGTWDMHVLMTIAATGGVLTGETFEAATAMFLFGVALAIERYSLERARRAVRSLAELSAPVAHRWTDDHWVDVEPEMLAPGDRIRVRAGERVPVDGTVESGRSTVNQAAITGESLPVDKEPGESVLGGSLNGEGSLDLVVGQTAEQSTLARIARLVEAAQNSRAPIERFVDRFARRYTPAVITLAVMIACGPPALAWLGWEPAGRVSAAEWLHRGLVLLVIACPCALVISTPVTIICGLFQAARQGFLIKGGQHLEHLAAVRRVAFDKTGTLTTGRLTLVNVAAEPPAVVDEVLTLAAGLEEHSEHPVARTIVAAARAQGVALVEAKNFRAEHGAGVSGTIAGHLYRLGNAPFAQAFGAEVARPLPPGEAQRPGSTATAISSPESDGAERGGAQVVVWLSREGTPLGRLELADEVRPEAKSAVARLTQVGIERVYLLTGDTPAAAREVAAQLGIHEVHGGLRPENKLEVVRDLMAEGSDLAMVGDGVNDAPALAAATVGIAWGRSASDTAVETADVVALATRVDRLADLLALAQRTRRILRQNIAWALGLKLAVLLLAAAGWATLWLAVAADVGASLLVTSNGMRLLGSQRHNVGTLGH